MCKFITKDAPNHYTAILNGKPIEFIVKVENWNKSDKTNWLSNGRDLVFDSDENGEHLISPRFKHIETMPTDKVVTIGECDYFCYNRYCGTLEMYAEIISPDINAEEFATALYREVA